MSAEVAVRLRTPDGREQVLRPGDLIGRAGRASLHIEDPRISEAHALVSLRGAELKLLALRGRMSLDGRPASAVTLTPGARIVLAGFFALTVVAVALPEHVLALEIGEGGEPLPLAGVMALHLETPARLVPSFDPEAAVIVWSNESGVFFRVRDGPDRHLAPGETIVIDGVPVCVARVPLETLAAGATLEQGQNDVALTLTLHYDTVHIRPSVGPPLVFDGLAARLLSEVAQLRTPVAWEALARLLWDDEDDEQILRQRWDQATSRIRKKLRAARIRSDLLRSTGAGLVELYLGPNDVVQDLS